MCSINKMCSFDNLKSALSTKKEDNERKLRKTVSLKTRKTYFFHNFVKMVRQEVVQVIVQHDV